jgi:nucleoside-diphosphate-sugar epimerase
MKVAITGSTGFVGNHLVRSLKNSGHIIDLIDLRSSSDIRLDSEIMICLHGKAHDLKNISNEEEYFYVNTKLTQKMFDIFLQSNTSTFIYISSVKAVADSTSVILTENHIPNPLSIYGKSKLKAEEYLLNTLLPADKRLFILRPCMIHGEGNKGNLNLLYNIIKTRIPWPLGSYNNKRSFCSIDNLVFIIMELITNQNINSGIYNVADDESLSTNDLFKLISQTIGVKSYIINVPKFVVNMIAKLGDILYLPINSERLHKLTESYVVSNIKIKNAINKSLPQNTFDGLIKTINSFK